MSGLEGEEGSASVAQPFLVLAGQQGHWSAAPLVELRPDYSLQPPARDRVASAEVPLATNRGAASATGPAHQEWCRRQYSTYDPARDSFLRYDGQNVHCVSPGE